MIRGLYTAAAGMLAGIILQEGIIQNLANVVPPATRPIAPL
jgi:flagellar basal body rod protein FlgG